MTDPYGIPTSCFGRSLTTGPFSSILIPVAGLGCSPTGVYLWKLLNGENTTDETLTALKRDFKEVPQEAGAHILAFVEDLTRHGLVTREKKRHLRIGRSIESPHETSMFRGDANITEIAYEAPKLVNFSGEPAHGGCSDGSGNTNSPSCQTGHNTTVACMANGNFASGGYCETGTSPCSGCQYCYQGCSVTSWRGCSVCSCGTQPGVCNTGDSAAYGCNPVGNSGA